MSHVNFDRRARSVDVNSVGKQFVDDRTHGRALRGYREIRTRILHRTRKPRLPKYHDVVFAKPYLRLQTT